VPSILEGNLEEIFNDIEKQYHDSNSEISQSDILNTKYSRLLPNHNDALHCLSIAYSLAHDLK
jgi:hypothetical protein